MIRQKEWQIPGGYICYEVKNGEAMVTGIGGQIGELTIPASVEECPVTMIGKKAFLSRKKLRKVLLPACLQRIEDWAFAYCSQLEEVVIRGEELTFGKSVFLECDCLKRLTIGADDPAAEQTAELMAAAVTELDAGYLLDIGHAGSEEWLRKWDARLKVFLAADDQEGFSRQVLCGEEDYGSTDLEAFMKNKRKRKVRMCFLRLLNPLGLSADLGRELERYLLEHEETQEVLIREFGHERRYYELFARIGCLNEENMNQLLQDIGEDYTEMKAFFLQYKEEKMGYADFFDLLTSDF